MTVREFRLSSIRHTILIPSNSFLVIHLLAGITETDTERQRDRDRHRKTETDTERQRNRVRVGKR